ncbi:MAG: PilZ domain-containing protein [Syntrophobacteraceae bacterium]|jgi:c-di-GMP-binding flagellar brake protein YcgR|nr:PilZ domain-containing protein [Syntrophobacteraceae bacterium]
MEAAQDRKEREYSRVDTFVSLQVSPVPPEARESLRSCSSHELLGVAFPPLPDIEDQALAQCLQIINAKLDAVLSSLSLQQEGVRAQQVSPVNISGSGLRFTSSEPLIVGELLKLKLVLPTHPDTVFQIYGHVVRSEPSTCEGNNVSVNFTVIDEDIRAKIVKFVFEKQREQLRNKRRQ